MLKTRAKTRDLLTRCFVDAFGVRVSAIYTPNIANAMRKKWHSESEQVTANDAQVWGEYMSGAMMLSSFFKGDERVNMRLRTHQYDAHLEAISVGEVTI